MDNAISTYELTLGRVLDYLAQSGVELTPAVVHRVLRVLEEALQHGESDLLPRVFANLGKHVQLPAPVLPYPTPPIHRSSMGYGQI